MPDKISKLPEPPPTFEEAMGKLEAIVDAMAQGDLPLDKLVTDHETAMDLLAFCQSKLESARDRIQLVERKSNGSVKLSLLPTDVDS